MDPSEISLDTMCKSFEYEKHARTIDDINDVTLLKDIAKSYIKLYLKQQEVMSSIGIPHK